MVGNDFVNKSIPANTTVVGAPAKVIKEVGWVSSAYRQAVYEKYVKENLDKK